MRTMRTMKTRRETGKRLGFLLVLALLLGACGDSASRVSLAVLVDYADRYDDRILVTEGTVRTFAEPRHYWIEDEDLNRVAITPDEAVSDYVGQRVQVRGRFSVSREAGRSIEAQSVSSHEH